MDLEAIKPIVQDIVKNVLLERRYEYGWPTKGLSNKKATGGLINSIKVIQIKENNTDILQVDMKDPNYKYVEKGRAKGKYVPIKAILKWMAQRGIGIRNEKGQFVKDDNARTAAAFRISNSIRVNGVRATGFIEIARKRIAENKQVMQLLEEAAMQELIDIIKFGK
jgi:hypothetical protein